MRRASAMNELSERSGLLITKQTMKEAMKNGIQSRLIANIQSTGRMGKSTVQQVLWEWLAFAGIASAAIDTDGEHRTLNAWYPEDVSFAPFTTRENLLPVLNACGDAPVELIDFPAQATTEILAGFEDFSALSILTEKRVRLTLLIFASDERAAMASAAACVNYVGDAADYVIVRNPARYPSDIFGHSKLAKMLSGAPAINLPRITQATLVEIDQASKAARRPLTLRQAETVVPIGSRMEIENFFSRCFTQCEDAADTLLPDASLIQTRVQRPKAKKPKQVDAFEL